MFLCVQTCCQILAQCTQCWTTPVSGQSHDPVKVQIIPQTTEICHSISYSSDNEICFRKVTDFSQTTKTCHCKLFFRQLKSWHTHYSSDNRNLLQYKLFLRQQRFVIFTLILRQLNFVMYKFVLRQMKLCNVTLFLKLKSVA